MIFSFRQIFGLKKRHLRFSWPEKHAVLYYDSDKDRGQLLGIGLDEKNMFRFGLESDLWVFNLIFAFLANLVVCKLSSTSLKDSYVKSVIATVRPKLMFSVTDNDKRFWSLKKTFPKTKTVLLQNGLRGLTDVISTKTSNNYRTADLSVDFLGVMSPIESHWYRENGLNISQLLVCGSIKNNSVPNMIGRENFSKNKKIVYLLQFKDFDFESGKAVETSYQNLTNQEANISYDELYEINIPIIESISQFCLKFGYELSVLGRAKNPHMRLREESFLRKHLNPSKYKYICDFSDRGVYTELQKYELIVALSSTLAHEMLARGQKVYFIGARQKIFGKSEVFAYGRYGDEGVFWGNGINEKQLSQKLSNLLDLGYPAFENLLDQYRDSLIKFGKGNAEVKSLFHQFI
ncbi:hypothetical protein N8932_00625 [Alphaproteobacteria bacterium]|nr:hypothetical protein [Alphaproteobacteria bacterium]